MAAARIFQGFTYFCVVGSSLKASTHYKDVMVNRLILMAESASESSLFAEQSAKEFEMAAKDASAASENIEEAESLQEEALALQEEAEKDMAEAGTSEALAKEVEAKTAEETLEETKDIAEAAALAAEEEELSDTAAEEFLKATSEEEELTGTGEAVATCEFIPIVDFVCDAVGAVAAAGFAAAAVADNAAAAAALAAAVTDEAERQHDIAEAAVLTEQIASDTELAAQYESEAAQAETRAQVEESQAQADQAMATDKQAQGEALGEKAQEEEAAAQGEEGEAGEKAKEAVSHGVFAFYNMIVATVVSIMSLIGFGIRLLTRFLKDTCNSSSSSLTREASLSSSSSWWMDRETWYYIFVHQLIFAAIFINFVGFWKTFSSDTPVSRGGSILWFSLVAATIQSLALHVLPHNFGLYFTRDYMLEQSETRFLLLILLGKFLLNVVLLLPLFCLEVVLLWISFGWCLEHYTIMEQNAASSIPNQIRWKLWVFLCISVIAYGMLFPKRNQPRATIQENDEEEQETQSLLLVTTHNKIDYYYYDKDLEFANEHNNSLQKPMFFSTSRERGVWERLQDLLYPLEMLVVACMVATLVASIPHVSTLYKLVQSTSHPQEQQE